MKTNIVLQIEKLLNIELEEFDSIQHLKFGTHSYIINNNREVVHLGLYNCKSNNLFSLIPLLEKLEFLISLDIGNNSIKNLDFIKNLKNLEILHLRKNEIEDLSPLNDLRNLKFLGLEYNKVVDISPLKSLKKLQKLLLQGNKIKNASEINKLHRLKELNLSSNQITYIYLNNLQDLTELDLSYNQFKGSCIDEEAGLEDLGFENYQIPYQHQDDLYDVLPELYSKEYEYQDINLSKLTNLENLYLQSNQISDTSFIEEFDALTVLDLSDNQIENIDLDGLNNLEELYLNDNISTQVYLGKLQNLIILNLANNQISDISSLENLESLIYLDLSGNQISDISSLKHFSKLTNLNLSYNQIPDIFDLMNLNELKRLELRNNPIKKLPEEIIDFELEIKWVDFELDSSGIYFYNNPLQNPVPEIVKQGNAAIQAWFIEQKNKSLIISPYVKLIVTGNTTVGKTSFIKFLTKQSYNSNESSTHGIKQYNWYLPNKTLHINIWDFGGQEYYHSTHQLFFSNNTLYLLMYDKEHNSNGWLKTTINYPDKENELENLEHFDYFYWLRNIRNITGNSKILMLQNKVEDPDDEMYPDNECFDRNNDYLVEKPFKAISVLNAFEFYTKHQRFSPEFEQVQKLIIQKLDEVKHGEIFEYYPKAKELIEEEAQNKPVVTVNEFIEICKPVNKNIEKVIIDENGHKTEFTAWQLMCIYFHEIGVLLYYPKSKSLKEKIFIRPTFVTDSIYKVLNYKVKHNYGKFTFIDAIESLDNNEELAKNIIELMSESNFKLIFNYPQGSDLYIAPQYLDDNKPRQNLLYHITKNMEIGFCIEFTKTLPKYILTEFMVKYGRFQKDDIIWKYGIVFEKDKTTAFIECIFNEKKIIYKSSNSGKSEQLKYEVFESLRKINGNNRNLNISTDNKYFYPLENILSDNPVKEFGLFRTGYRSYTANKITHKEYIQLLIAKANLEKAFQEFLKGTKINGQQKLHGYLLLLSSRFNSNNTNNLAGLLSNENYNLEKNKISYALNEYLNEYKPSSTIEFE